MKDDDKKVRDVLALVQAALGPLDADALHDLEQAIEKARRSTLPAWALRLSRVKTVRAETLVRVHGETRKDAEDYFRQLQVSLAPSEIEGLPEVEDFDDQDQDEDEVEIEAAEPYDEDEHGSIPVI